MPGINHAEEDRKLQEKMKRFKANEDVGKFVDTLADKGRAEKKEALTEFIEKKNAAIRDLNANPSPGSEESQATYRLQVEAAEGYLSDLEQQR